MWNEGPMRHYSIQVVIYKKLTIKYGLQHGAFAYIVQQAINSPKILD